MKSNLKKTLMSKKTVIILIILNQQLGENMRAEDTSMLRDCLSS